LTTFWALFLGAMMIGSGTLWHTVVPSGLAKVLLFVKAAPSLAKNGAISFSEP
jgi:hypothetical protein